MKYMTLLTAMALLCTTAQGQQEPAQTIPAEQPGGMVVPMLSDDQMRTQTPSGQGQLVFNKDMRGFFYFDGTDWQPLLLAQRTDGGGIQWSTQRTGDKPEGEGVMKLTTGTSGFWDLTGNAATDPAVNFIGTTDAQDLIFRVNGALAGQLADGQSEMVSFGFDAGSVNTGTNNTFIGRSAGKANTSGLNNTFVGQNAGVNVTTGINNTIMGMGAGAQNTTGSRNTFLGRQAGGGNTSNDNTMVGANAGNSNSAGTRNTFVGGLAGGSTNGSDNVVIGNEDAIVATSPLDRSVVIGTRTMVPAQPSADATLIGYDVHVGTNGITNAAAIGSRSQVDASNAMVLGSINGVNGATANTNVGIGTTAPADRLHVVGNIRMVDGLQGSGKVMTSNANGTASWQSLPAASVDWGRTGNAGTNPATDFIGTTDAQAFRFRSNNLWAGQLPNTGNGVVGYGLGAGQVNTGNDNTFIGNSAGGSNTTGINNTFVGRVAGAFNATTSNNTFLGAAAGQNSVGNSSTLIGSFAGVNTTSGGQNTFIGNAAGSANTTGAENTALGLQSGNSITTGGNNTIIGSNADVASGALTNATAVGARSQVDASNSLVLGSVNGVNGATATVNVGIGTTTPADRLHVAGNIRMVDGNQAAGKVMTADANGTATWQTLPTASADWGRTGNAGTNAATNFIGTTDAVDFRVRTNNTERISVSSSGRTGIGTSAPAVLLDVNGGFALREGTTVNVSGTTTITVGDRSYIRMTAGAASNAILTDGLRVGQLLYLQHLGGLTGLITITDNAATTNCNLVANRTLGPQDLLTLLWDGNDWIEIGFANN